MIRRVDVSAKDSAEPNQVRSSSVLKMTRGGEGAGPKTLPTTRGHNSRVKNKQKRCVINCVLTAKLRGGLTFRAQPDSASENYPQLTRGAAPNMVRLAAD